MATGVVYKMAEQNINILNKVRAEAKNTLGLFSGDTVEKTYR